MTCAKRHVECRIEIYEGIFTTSVTGTNGCANPQETCPRLPGEDYTKCKTICQQGDHAERDALTKAKTAGLDVRGARAILTGHHWMCDACGTALRDAGVNAVLVLLK